jgi:DNA-binding NarL/FixJ family response regulator
VQIWLFAVEVDRRPTSGIYCTIGALRPPVFHLGISVLRERRSGIPRRSGRDRRVGQLDKFGLTPRQLVIVANVVAGLSNKEIAKKLSISEDTVKHHLTNIFDKVGVSTRLELALFATHYGLIAG